LTTVVPYQLGCMDYLPSLQPQWHHAKPRRKVDFEDRLDILLYMRLSSVAERLIRRCQFIIIGRHSGILIAHKQENSDEGTNN